jgi:hypothetical protein
MFGSGHSIERSVNIRIAKKGRGNVTHFTILRQNYEAIDIL